MQNASWGGQALDTVSICVLKKESTTWFYKPLFHPTFTSNPVQKHICGFESLPESLSFLSLWYGIEKNEPQLKHPCLPLLQTSPMIFRFCWQEFLLDGPIFIISCSGGIDLYYDIWLPHTPLQAVYVIFMVTTVLCQYVIMYRHLFFHRNWQYCYNSLVCTRGKEAKRLSNQVFFSILWSGASASGGKLDGMQVTQSQPSGYVDYLVLELGCQLLWASMPDRLWYVYMWWKTSHHQTGQRWCPGTLVP